MEDLDFWTLEVRVPREVWGVVREDVREFLKENLSESLEVMRVMGLCRSGLRAGAHAQIW